MGRSRETDRQTDRQRGRYSEGERVRCEAGIALGENWLWILSYWLTVYLYYTTI